MPTSSPSPVGLPLPLGLQGVPWSGHSSRPMLARRAGPSSATSEGSLSQTGSEDPSKLLSVRSQTQHGPPPACRPAGEPAGVAVCRGLSPSCTEGDGLTDGLMAALDLGNPRCRDIVTYRESTVCMGGRAGR